MMLVHMFAHTFILGFQYLGKVCPFSIYKSLNQAKLKSIVLTMFGDDSVHKRLWPLNPNLRHEFMRVKLTA